jgi:hypothetical protein
VTTYYLVGSSGNWQGGTIWALSSGGTATAQTPTSTDDVVFDLHSTGTVTIGTNSNCHNLTMTAPGAGTITMGGTAVLNIYGSMALAAGMTFNPAATGIINFLGTTTGLTVTHAGYSLCNMTYNGVGGEWTWQDNQTNVSSGPLTITLTNGSLITGGFSAGAANGVSLSSSNSNVRSLILGSTTWKLNPTQAAAIWDLGTTTGLTFSGAGSTITLGAASTFNGGGLTYGTVSGTLMQGSGVDNFINGANAYTNLTLSALAGSNQLDFAYRLGADQTVTGTFTASNGNNSVVNRRVYITSNVKGTPRTITAAAVSANYLDLQDIIGAGAASWDLSVITGGSGDCGGNSGIIFTPAANQYYKTAFTSTWSNASKWFLATNGGGGAGRVPLPQDTAIFDSHSFTTTGLTLTTDVYHVCSINWSGVANNPAWSNNVALNLFGDLTLDAGMTFSAPFNSIMFEKRGIVALTTAGQTVPYPLILNNITGVGSLPITSAILTSNTFTLTSGTVNLSNQLSVTGIILNGGITTDTGISGEYKGTTFSCTGGTHTIRKLTLSSTFAQSGGTITVPANGSATWATSWTWTGATFTFTTVGIPTWTLDTLNVVPAGNSGGSWLSC